MLVLHQLAWFVAEGCVFGVIGLVIDWKSGGKNAEATLILGFIAGCLFTLIGVGWAAATGIRLEQELLGHKSSLGLAIVLTVASIVIYAVSILRRLVGHRLEK